LKTFVGNLLGDDGDKVAWGEGFKVAPDLGIHAGGIDKGSSGRTCGPTAIAFFNRRLPS
jgi:hypothetical protein